MRQFVGQLCAIANKSLWISEESPKRRDSPPFSHGLMSRTARNAYLDVLLGTPVINVRCVSNSAFEQKWIVYPVSVTSPTAVETDKTEGAISCQVLLFCAAIQALRA
jgi:hypothetical protein